MRKALALALLLSPCAVSAAGGYIDGYYTPKADLAVTDPALGSGEDDGDGFGVRGLAPVSDSLALSGEYQSVKYEDSDLEFEQRRLGAGLIGASGNGLLAEYIEFSDGEESVEGYGVHLRLASQDGSAHWHGQVGYVSLEDEAGEEAKGLEYSLGLTLPLSAQWSGLLDYRKTSLEDDADVELELKEFRVGLRLGF